SGVREPAEEEDREEPIQPGSTSDRTMGRLPIASTHGPLIEGRSYDQLRTTRELRAVSTLCFGGIFQARPVTLSCCQITRRRQFCGSRGLAPLVQCNTGHFPPLSMRFRPNQSTSAQTILRDSFLIGVSCSARTCMNAVAAQFK